MFFLATADAEGQPDVSYKGGVPGFVRIVDDRTLAFPDYDGNGMRHGRAGARSRTAMESSPMADPREPSLSSC